MGKWTSLLLTLPVVAWEGPGVGGVGGAAGEVPVAQAAALTPLQDVVQAPRHPAILVIILKVLSSEMDQAESRLIR
jgi:hypothetical protein